jgi:phospholipid/cholesterol/gamma-HCH transport system permease protein
MVFSGRVYGPLLFDQMVMLGVNSIPITMLVMCFAGSVYTYMLADELNERGMGSYTGSFLMLILLREFVPMFTAIVLSGKVGAAITSEIGTMKISEQLDALKALSTDPDWYLTLPRVLGAFLMMPVIAVFGGYAGWYAGAFTAQQSAGINYANFRSNIKIFVDPGDFMMCLSKSLIYGAVLVITACYFGYRAEGGASGVGRAVTSSVVTNILLLFVLDLIITAAFN